MHIDPTGSRSLHACLPPALWRMFVETAGDPGKGFGFFDENLSPLVIVEDAIDGNGAASPQEGHHAVSRLTLRQILLAGLEGRVHFGRQFAGYETTADGKSRGGLCRRNARRGRRAGRRGRRKFAGAPAIFA